MIGFPTIYIQPQTSNGACISTTMRVDGGISSVCCDMVVPYHLTIPPGRPDWLQRNTRHPMFESFPITLKIFIKLTIRKRREESLKLEESIPKSTSCFLSLPCFTVWSPVNFPLLHISLPSFHRTGSSLLLQHCQVGPIIHQGGCFYTPEYNGNGKV